MKDLGRVKMRDYRAGQLQHALYLPPPQASPAESLAQPLLFMGPFIRSQPYSCGLAPSEASSTRETVTLIDVCRGGTEHISLKHVVS